MRKANTSAPYRETPFRGEQSEQGRLVGTKAPRWLALAAGLLVQAALAAPPQPVKPSQTPPAAPPTEKPAETLAKAEETIRAWPLPPDRTTLLPTRRPDEARLRELRADSAFQYEEPAEEEFGLWDRFWRWIGRWFDRLLGSILSTKGGQLTWKYGWYAALVAALVFAVLKLLQVDLTGVFGRNPRRTGLGYDVLDEDIHGIDFPGRLAEAEAAGNYRLAVRLGYLEILKHLSDQDRIRWEPNKTNHAYLHELPTGPLREAFWLATRQFEYVWYGELLLTATQYAPVRTAQRAVLAAASSTAYAAA